MKNPHIPNILNAAFLIVLGAVFFFLSESDKPWTALIPSVFGVILLAMTPGIKSHNKIIAHVAVLLVLLGGLSGIGMAGKSLAGDDMSDPTTRNKVIEQGLMGVSCLITLGFFISNFIYIRKQRQLEQGEIN